MMKPLWNDNGTLNLSTISKAEFRVEELDSLVLVCPKKNKWDWTVEERWLRSVVVDRTGRVVSIGWPKFGNYNEFQDDTCVLHEALAGHAPVRFTAKEDGSLCIRDVVDGKVMFRTRGTMWGGQRGDDGTPSFGERFAAVAAHKYPCLIDPAWGPKNTSMLFEYVAPDNQVVVRYREEDLVLIGMVKHSRFIVPWPQLSTFARESDLNLVELVTMPTDIQGILELVKDWKSEGVVVRTGRVGEAEDQIFVKVKSAWYLANHRMKSSMNYDMIVEFVATSGVTSEDDLVNALRASGFDFEIIEGAKELYSRYRAAEAFAEEKRVEALRLFAEFVADPMMEKLRDVPKLRRKEYALIACAQDSFVRGMMFAMYDEKKDDVAKLVRRIVATEGKGRIK